MWVVDFMLRFLGILIGCPQDDTALRFGVWCRSKTIERNKIKAMKSGTALERIRVTSFPKYFRML